MTIESVTPENAAILIQKHMRSYLDRNQYIDKVTRIAAAKILENLDVGPIGHEGRGN